MDPTVLLSSAVVAVIVGGLTTYFGQRRLAERQAQIDYESNARRRLYEAIGPLRLQLLFAARAGLDCAPTYAPGNTFPSGTGVL